MKILVTNDDGAHAPGLWALVRTLRGIGDVVVSAPDRDRSGVGPALSVNELIRAKAVHSALPDVPVYAVEGTPGDAAILGLRKLVDGPVDVVVSGINPGTNVGEDVIISGTVGAGVHAFLNGVPTLAVSVAGETDPAHPVVEAVTREAVRQLARPDGVPMFVNLNFPDLEKGPARGVRETSVAARFLKDGVDSLSRGHRTYYWVLRRGGRSVDSTSATTDVWAIRNGFISMSLLYPEFAHAEARPRLDAMVQAAAGVV